MTAFQQAEGGVVDLIPLSLPVDATTCRPMAGDLPAVRDFVAATPGELAQARLRGATPRETLRTFLTHHRSCAAAAQAMNPHRDSVQYRVQQASALLPHGARSLGDDFDVRAALLASHWLGSALLT